MKYLRGSFGALLGCCYDIHGENMIKPCVRTSSGKTTRFQFASDAVAHSYDNYGQGWWNTCEL